MKIQYKNIILPLLLFCSEIQSIRFISAATGEPHTGLLDRSMPDGVTVREVYDAIHGISIVLPDGTHPNPDDQLFGDVRVVLNRPTVMESLVKAEESGELSITKTPDGHYTLCINGMNVEICIVKVSHDNCESILKLIDFAKTNFSELFFISNENRIPMAKGFVYPHISEKNYDDYLSHCLVCLLYAARTRESFRGEGIDLKDDRSFREYASYLIESMLFVKKISTHLFLSHVLEKLRTFGGIDLAHNFLGFMVDSDILTCAEYAYGQYLLLPIPKFLRLLETDKDLFKISSRSFNKQKYLETIIDKSKKSRDPFTTTDIEVLSIGLDD